MKENRNYTLMFKKGDQVMYQKCGKNYPISRENVEKMMKMSGWTLVAVRYWGQENEIHAYQV